MKLLLKKTPESENTLKNEATSPKTKSPKIKSANGSPKVKSDSPSKPTTNVKQEKTQSLDNFDPSKVYLPPLFFVYFLKTLNSSYKMNFSSEFDFISLKPIRDSHVITDKY